MVPHREYDRYGVVCSTVDAAFPGLCTVGVNSLMYSLLASSPARFAVRPSSTEESVVMDFYRVRLEGETV